MTDTRDLQRQDDITRAAIGIFEQIFAPARQHEFAPRKGTLMHKLWQCNRLTLRQQRAWHHFTLDLYSAVGKSGPVVSAYSEAVSKSDAGEFRAPTAKVNAQYTRMERLVKTLIRQERILLMDLIADDLQNTGALSAGDIGFALCGYRDRAQASAAGTATIGCLLSKIGDFYSV
jgi:hypothetical protein